MIQWPSGAKVTIGLADCGAVVTIRRSNYCLNCTGKLCQCCAGTGKHKGHAEWESQFKDYSIPTISLLQACPKGHPYNEDNTRWTTDRRGMKTRKCKECDRVAARERYRKKNAA